MWSDENSRQRVDPQAKAELSPEGRPVVDERRVTAWIGKALIVQGKVISTEHLTIDGQVDGTIELGDHSLTIGLGAIIRADLVAKTITISGAVTGNVMAIDKVDLRASASVDGDIVAPRLVMAEGAVIRGRVETDRKKAAAAAAATATEAKQHTEVKQTTQG